MARVSRNASIPYRPYSRPTPEYLNPPQGACGSSVMPLITTRPARICEATRRARWRSVPEDGGVKTILGVVGDPDRVVLGVVGDDAQHGAENLFLGDRHVVLHVDEHRGLHEVTRFETFRMALAADQHLGAFFDALADVGLHALVLFLRHHRSDGGLGIGRIADGKCAHRVPDGPLDRVEPALRHEEPRPRGAGLTAVHEGHDESRRNRLFEIGVIEQDRGRLAAQLQRDALHRRGAVAHDRFAHGHRARERDLVDVRIAHEFGADDIAEARHDVADALWELGPSMHSTNTRVCSELNSLGLMTTVQPAATAEASLRQMNSAFAFHAVIRPATPTGSKVTVVLPQLRVHGISWSAFSAAGNALTPDSTMSPANWTTPPYSSTIAAVRSSMRAEAASCSRRKISARSSFVVRP